MLLKILIINGFVILCTVYFIYWYSYMDKYIDVNHTELGLFMAVTLYKKIL